MLMQHPQQAALRRLIDSAIARQPGGDGLVIANHLQQIEDLVIGQGIDWMPEQDPMGDRTPFVGAFVAQTRLKAFLPDILRKVMGTGEVLTWLRFTENGYRLRYFSAPQFEPYYDPATDDLYAAIVVTSFVEKTLQGSKTRWLKLVILRQGYFSQVSDSRPSLQGLGDNSQWDPTQAPPDPQSFSANGKNEVSFTANPFPFLPIRILQNKPTGPSQRAADDFTEFARQLVTHDAVAGAVRKNVRKFAQQTIVTNLRREQILKKASLGGFSGAAPSYGSSPAYAADYYDAAEMSAWRGAQAGAGEEEIADIIGVDGMEDEYFLDVLEWRPVEGSQVAYMEGLESQIHSALGSSRERGGNTAYETRSNISWAQATANKKAENTLTKGLCKVIEDAIAFEEQLFIQTSGGLGLYPAGDRTVRWRRIELIAPTPQEQLQTSILGRNLEEEGVGTSEILKLLFPSKTEKEIQALTGGSGGIPFRKIDKTVPKLMELIGAAGELGPLGGPLLAVADMLLNNLMEAIQYGRRQPDDLDQPSRSTISQRGTGDIAQRAGLAAIAAAAAADAAGATPGTEPGPGLVSGANQPAAANPGDVPADAAGTGNPITAAFGRFTDPKRSPILRALSELVGAGTTDP